MSTYEYFYESLKITCFLFLKNLFNIYKDGKPKLQKQKF